MHWRTRLLPFVFVGPAMAILAWYLAIPTLRTFWISLFDRDGPPKGTEFIPTISSERVCWSEQLCSCFHQVLMLEAFRNNLMWIIFGSTFSVAFGC
jgi:alpha-glucoside transport system permease protein